MKVLSEISKIKRRNLIKCLASLFFISPRIIFAKPSGEVNIENGDRIFDFNQSLGGRLFDDYSVVLQKAVDYCSHERLTLQLSGNYTVTKTIVIPNDLYIIGNSKTSIKCLENNPITILHANNKKNISIIGVEINGNVTGDIGKSFKRTTRFINSSNIHIENFTVINNADWAISFEDCDSIVANKIKVYGGGRGRPGGRDGLHFLDCSNVSVSDADIVSGDDCVAITSKYKNIKNIKIKNVTGSSDIGSIVIYNEEQFKNKRYTYSNVDKLIISDVSVRKGGNARDIVRVFAYNEKTQIKNVIINGVSGASKNHALFLGSIDGLVLKNIDVSSHNQHGIYILKSHNVELDKIKGTSNANHAYGVSILKSSNIKGNVSSQDMNKNGRIFVAKSSRINITN
nr:glycosyl hydrolase family 28 protein [uncultured Erwinia sp.]